MNETKEIKEIQWRGSELHISFNDEKEIIRIYSVQGGSYHLITDLLLEQFPTLKKLAYGSNN